MKTLKLFIIAVAIFVTTSASATDLTWSLMSGVSRSDFSAKNHGDMLMDNSGYSLGLSLKADLSLIEIGPEIIYSYNSAFIPSGSNYFGLNESGNVKCHSVDIPVVAAMYVYGPLQVEVGPTFSLYNNAEVVYGTEGEDSKSLGRMKSDVGYLLGAKVQILGRLLVGARFYSQFEPNRVEFNGKSEKIRYRCFSLSLGANF